MIQYLRMEGNQNMFFPGGLNIYSNFSKIVIKAIRFVRRISDCFIISCDSDGKSWLDLFTDTIFFIQKQALEMSCKKSCF